MKPTLVVMAAGVGSRYGGLKQVEPVGPSGEIMLDYSVFDAIRAGFGKVVFIIRIAIANDFKAVVGSHFLDRVPVEYAFQELSDLPPGFSVPADRTKPWGTGHAILRCKDMINEPFAVINADDSYGRSAYVIMSEALRKLSVTDNTYAMVGYRLANTLSDHGDVARGVCEIGPGNMLVSVVERLKIEKTTDGARYMNEAEEWVETSGREIVSMNMFGFTPTLFAYLERMFPAFLSDACGGKQATGKPKAEFLIPTIVHDLIREGRITMEVLETTAKWFGVTYKEDMPGVVANIRKLVDAGVYPDPLWG